MLKLTLFAAAMALPATAYAAPATQPPAMPAMPGMPAMPAKPEAMKDCCCDKMKAKADAGADHQTHAAPSAH